MSSIIGDEQAVSPKPTINWTKNPGLGSTIGRTALIVATACKSGKSEHSSGFSPLQTSFSTHRMDISRANECLADCAYQNFSICRFSPVAETDLPLSSKRRRAQLKIVISQQSNGSRLLRPVAILKPRKIMRYTTSQHCSRCSLLFPDCLR